MIVNTDNQILTGFRSGAPDLFYQKVYPGLVIYAERYLGQEDRFIAEDVVQDAVVGAWKKRSSFHSLEQLKSFLYNTIKNSIIDNHRRKSVQEKYIRQLENSESFLNTILEQEAEVALFKAIHALPEQMRQIFELNFFEGLKIAEIAQQLGIAERTVKKYKAEALMLLRKNLDPQLFMTLFLMTSSQ